MGVRVYLQQVAQVLTVWLVGKFVGESQPSTNASPYDPLGITQPISLSTPSKTEHTVTNEMALQESQPLSRPDWPQQSVSPSTQEVTAAAGSSIGERTSYPPADESPENVNSMKSMGGRDAEVSPLPLICGASITYLADLTTHRASSIPCKPTKPE